MDLSEHVCTWRCVMMQERKQKGKILVFSSREICYLLRFCCGAHGAGCKKRA